MCIINSEIFSLTDNNIHPWIFLKGVSGYHMRLVLDFLYLGEVEVPETELGQFLSTAGELKVRGLTKYAGGLGNMAELKTPDTSGHLHQTVTENEELTEIEETVPEKLDNEMTIVEDDQQCVAENFIEVNAELDQKIEDILVKTNGVWTCRVCGKFANHKSKLKQHVETHIDGFSHPCGICGKSYRSRNVLRMHLSRDHRNKKSQV